MAPSPPLSSSWRHLPLCPSPATPDPPSSRLPQLRRHHCRREEQHRPQPFNPLDLVPSVRFRSNVSDRGFRFAHARPYSLARLSAPKPSSVGLARSAHSPPLSLTLPSPPISARPLARALGRRSNLSRWF
jgi:hypothetical protein